MSSWISEFPKQTIININVQSRRRPTNKRIHPNRLPTHPLQHGLIPFPYPTTSKPTPTPTPLPPIPNLKPPPRRNPWHRRRFRILLHRKSILVPQRTRLLPLCMRGNKLWQRVLSNVVRSEPLGRVWMGRSVVAGGVGCGLRGGDAGGGGAGGGVDWIAGGPEGGVTRGGG